MNEGFFINYSRNGLPDEPNNWIKIDEHERWIRVPSNAKKIGVSDDVIENFKDYTPVEDRDEFLKYVLANSPIIRMRGHGAYFAFEFSSKKVNAPLWEIFEFMNWFGGAYTGMVIVNFSTGEKAQMRFEQFRGYMDDDNSEAILRIREGKNLPEDSLRAIFGDTLVSDLVIK